MGVLHSERNADFARSRRVILWKNVRRISVEVIASDIKIEFRRINYGARSKNLRVVLGYRETGLLIQELRG